MWAAITVSAMAAPHLVASFQMINFLHHKLISRDKTSTNVMLSLVSWLSIGPLFIVFMVFMDTIMIFNSTCIVPFAYILHKICGCKCLSYGIEAFYSFFFQMTSAELSGVRHMRTITQLTFESVLQFGV